MNVKSNDLFTDQHVDLPYASSSADGDIRYLLNKIKSWPRDGTLLARVSLPLSLLIRFMCSPVLASEAVKLVSFYIGRRIHSELL